MAKSSQLRLQTLASYLRPYWQKSLLGIFSLLIVNALGIYIPKLISQAIDNLEVATEFNEFLYYVLTIVIFASIMWVIRVLSRILIFGVGRQVEFDLKQKIFNRLLKLEPSYFSNNTIGDLINRATSDVDNIRRLLGFAVLSISNTIFAYGLTIPIMLSINVRLTLLAISVYPIMLILVKIFSNKLQSQQLAVQEELSNMTDLIQEDMNGISLIKIYAQEENERRAFSKYNQRLLNVNLDLARTRNILFPLLISLASSSLLILLVNGSSYLETGELTVGNFVALIIYIERLIVPTALLGFTITAYQRGEVSIDRIEAILTVEPKIKDYKSPLTFPQVVQGSIKSQGLTYTYPGSTIPALDNINFLIQPGETIAIVGPIGSGKSTLANTLPRLLNIDIDQLFIDDYDVHKLRLEDLRKMIAYVPQESFLFSTTIKNNICYGDPAKEQKEIEFAAKQAQIHTEILNFPQQYETIVGERGITLSGGQRQRTALARALLVDGPILILDDALSSVDNETATNILQNLSIGTKKKTVIFITHQMSAVAATADRIFVMHKGKIVQAGNHVELLGKPGLYQLLWQQQNLKKLSAYD
ncbi:MAG: ABC transporter ATP-binding protein/permease [Trichodesmium sp. MAG_R04]|nr:ABC transporter ATP-binding protein/permease [Trichodesmium sp. MAG_R04]